jgi:hypothetical protein
VQIGDDEYTSREYSREVIKDTILLEAEGYR